MSCSFISTQPIMDASRLTRKYTMESDVKAEGPRSVSAGQPFKRTEFDFELIRHVRGGNVQSFVQKEGELRVELLIFTQFLHHLPIPRECLKWH